MRISGAFLVCLEIISRIITTICFLDVDPDQSLNQGSETGAQLAVFDWVIDL